MARLLITLDASYLITTSKLSNERIRFELFAEKILSSDFHSPKFKFTFQTVIDRVNYSCARVCVLENRNLLWHNFPREFQFGGVKARKVRSYYIYLRRLTYITCDYCAWPFENVRLYMCVNFKITSKTHKVYERSERALHLSLKNAENKQMSIWIESVIARFSMIILPLLFLLHSFLLFFLSIFRWIARISFEKFNAFV